ncbi:MAG TPA: response regulator [Methanospirillum sp.]|nr:response regulator [Methanospirillum sp.]
MLVVEDERVQQKVIGAKLHQLGYPVCYAGNGQSALDLMRTQQVDLILLDLMMPGMNGYDVLEAMKADAELRFIPVIILSRIEDMDSIIRCIEVGATDYLTKPVNMTLLSARIKASLAQRRLRNHEVEYYKSIETISKKLELMDRITRHDLANSLTKARGYSEVLESYVNDGEGAQYLEKLGNSLDEITNTLVFARTYHDIGKKEPAWQHILSILSKIQERCSQNIMVTVATPDCEVYADLMLEMSFLTWQITRSGMGRG